jgi:hypothetical protein
MYRPETESATALFDVLAEQNKAKLSLHTDKSVAAARQLIDIQSRITSHFISLLVYPALPWRKGHKELNALLLNAFHNNLFSSYAVLLLTVSGLYGPARPILRAIFECLMIAKFSAVSENTAVMQRWHNRETVYFSKCVLKKIVIPDPEAFSDMWNLLCDFSHASRYYGQVSIELDEVDSEQQSLNLAILNALLECNYHLLNSLLITSEIAYMAKFYITGVVPAKRSYDIPELRKKAHCQFSENRTFLGSESIKLIAAYKRKWVVK